MSPVAAYHVLTWVAIAVLFLGLAAVLREVRLLRGQVAGTDPDGFATAPPDIALGPRLAGPGPRVVLAVDSGCALCLAVTERLAGAAPGPGRPAVTLLTHEPAQTWAGAAGRLAVVSDREAWRAVAHLSPPVLMLVDDTGRVRRMVLPVRVSDVDKALAGWPELSREEGADVTASRGHS